MRKGDVGTREKEAAAQTAMTKLNTEAATRLAQLEADAQINQANIKSQSNVAANKASVEAKMKVALLTGEQNSRQAQIDADNLYMSQKASIEARTKVRPLGWLCELPRMRQLRLTCQTFIHEAKASTMLYSRPELAISQ